MKRKEKARKSERSAPTQFFVYWAATVVLLIGIGTAAAGAIPLLYPANPCIKVLNGGSGNVSSSCKSYSPSVTDFYDFALTEVGNAIHIGLNGIVLILLAIAVASFALFVGLVWTAWRVKHDTVLVRKGGGRAT